MSIHIRHISAHYGQKPVLHDISIADFHPGQCLGLIGPNGAGKTTLFRCLAGLQPCTGDVAIGDKALKTSTRTQWSRVVAMMPQQYDAAIALSVFESILLALKSQGNWHVEAKDLAAVEHVIAELDLGELAERPLHALSGGQKQMVALARLLVRKPPLVLLDEPTSALDLHRQIAAMQTMRNALNTHGISSIVIMHDLNLAAEYCDRLLLLDQGRLLLDDTPENVLSSPALAQTYRVQSALEKTRRGTCYVDCWLKNTLGQYENISHD